MFEIRFGDGGEILLSGRLDASRTAEAERFLAEVREAAVVDLGGLEYISSAGLGALLAAQKRLMGSGAGLTLVNANKHIFDIFRYSGFDQVFDIRAAGS